jgi:hypothetical protein
MLTRVRVAGSGYRDNRRRLWHGIAFTVALQLAEAGAHRLKRDKQVGAVAAFAERIRELLGVQTPSCGLLGSKIRH